MPYSLPFSRTRPRFAAPALGAALLLAGTLAAASAQAQTAAFRFEGTPTGTTATFSDTQSGDTATFSTTAGGVFSVEDSIFSTLSGHVLTDGLGASAGSTNRPLTITFSQASSSFAVDFAQNIRTPGSLVADFFFGGTQIGTASAVGSVLASGFDEGTLAFRSGSPFDSVVLTSPNATAFAIDNLRVDAAAPVPEASTTVSLGLLLALGMGGVLVAAKRKKAT